ncbi:response regulator transcription factor [Geminicoccus roseus]|uniref:response regulator transcription factor n=1 Tax=Geminicoccus roseus TaxID=404900 RepID=UPI000414CC80|nr:response regulator transcription factor [Geminicoccus roseus]
MTSQTSTWPTSDRAAPVVLVVDDDQAVREALGHLFRSVGLEVALFDNALDSVRGPLPDAACCLVLDIRLPQVSGLDFQHRLAEAGIEIPIVFMTGHGDIPMSVRAMKAGAVDFLTKPFREQDMLDAVSAALQRDRQRREAGGILEGLRARLAGLSPREQEVMRLVCAGLMNKQIAARLGLSEITVKVHRRHVMEKMEAGSLAELVRMAGRLGQGRAER